MLMRGISNACVYCFDPINNSVSHYKIYPINMCLDMCSLLSLYFALDVSSIENKLQILTRSLRSLIT